MKLGREIGEAVLSLLFPPRCVGCGEFETFLCAGCRSTLIPIGSACRRCGNPVPRTAGVTNGGFARCSECHAWEPGFEVAASAFRYEGIAVDLVTALKYRGERVLARTLAESAAPAFERFLSGVPGAEAAATATVLTWVPAHGRAERDRGYNQAELLCRSLEAGRAPDLPVRRLTVKTAKTRSQRELGADERRVNLRGAFAVAPGTARELQHLPVAPRSVVLVDDVYTTGATAHEVASVLREGIGLPVYVFTFSRTPGRPTAEGVEEAGGRGSSVSGVPARSALDVVSFAVR